MLAIHPGRVLKRELVARELSANQLALALSVHSGRIVDIMNGKRGITADTALRLGRYFGNNPQFWMNLQSQYDLAVASNEYGETIKSEVRLSA
ncbi:MAG: HigA family addiction module antidote protein [Gammaproteobacteria bacterium]|nr:HigA family addiction module antidote protein [Gammaproteobacteria bacterium]